MNSDCNLEIIAFSVGNVNLNMLIDLGASSNIERTWAMLKANRIACESRVPQAECKLYAYSSSEPLPVKGIFTCQVGIGGRSTQAEFIVIRGQGEPLLGKETAIELGVLKIGTNISAVRDTKAVLNSSIQGCLKEWVN